MTTDLLRKSIYAAFENTVTPKVFTESERADDWEIAEKFEGKHWSQVPSEIVSYDYDALSYATDEAYCHYLPAYLIVLLSESNRAGGMVYSVRGAMSCAGDGKRGTFLSKHKHLSLEQMLVVIEVLKWWAELEKADEYEYKEIERVAADWQWLAEQMKSKQKYMASLSDESFIRTTYSPALKCHGENHYRVIFLNSGFYWTIGILLIIAIASAWLFRRNTGYAFFIAPVGILIVALFLWDKLHALEKQYRIELKDGCLWVGTPTPTRNVGKVLGVLSVYLTGHEDPQWTDGSSRLYLFIKPDTGIEFHYPLFIESNTTEKIGHDLAKAVGCPYQSEKGIAHLPTARTHE